MKVSVIVEDKQIVVDGVAVDVPAAIVTRAALVGVIVMTLVTGPV